MKKALLPTLILFVWALNLKSPLSAQVVNVNLSLDRSFINAGEFTTLRVFAHVSPSLRTNADRIFSWYVDALNTNAPVALANYDLMLKTSADQNPLTSSTGIQQGSNRRGIYDTFMNLPGAGVTNPVELMSIPVQGLTSGRTEFRVQPGTGVAALSHDFLVAPIAEGSPYFGGSYEAAQVSLTVVPLASVSISVNRISGVTNRVTLTFPTIQGFNYRVESTDQLGSHAGWQTVPGGPHNSGTVVLTNTTSLKFYRVAASP